MILFFFRKLIEELNILQEENETIYNRFKVLLSQIHKTVQFRIAVSVSEVYVSSLRFIYPFTYILKFKLNYSNKILSMYNKSAVLSYSSVGHT